MNLFDQDLTNQNYTLFNLSESPPKRPIIQFIKRVAIDTQKWDKCIQSAYNSLPYAFSWYLDATTSGCWDALVLGDYKAVMPLPYNRKLFGFKQVYQPFFSQQLGVFAANEMPPLQLTAFLKSIPSSFLRVHTQLNTDNSIASLTGFDLTERPTYTLDLNISYTELSTAYSKGLRSNLKKANKNRLQIKKLSVAEFLTFYEANPVEKGKGYNTQLMRILTRLLYELEAHQKGKAVGTFTPEGELCAAFFLVESEQRAIYLLARSTDTGRKCAGMPYLIDGVLQELTGKNQVFDFEGSSISSLAKFFRSFGAQEELYFVLRKKGKI